MGRRGDMDGHRPGQVRKVDRQTDRPGQDLGKEKEVQAGRQTDRQTWARTRLYKDIQARKATDRPGQGQVVVGKNN